jgi:hypothetical protein
MCCAAVGYRDTLAGQTAAQQKKHCYTMLFSTFFYKYFLRAASATHYPHNRPAQPAVYAAAKKHTRVCGPVVRPARPASVARPLPKNNRSEVLSTASSIALFRAAKCPFSC